MVKELVIIFALIPFFITGTILADNFVSDIAPVQHHQDLSSLTPGQVLWNFDVETPSMDNQCLGVEYFDGYFIVTGGGGTEFPDPNKLHFFTEDGVYLKSIGQPSKPGWGWRDLCYDGTYFYGSDDSSDITQFFITRMTDYPDCIVVGKFRGPLYINRALAYDPETDHFWTANFVSSIYEITRTGSIVKTYANTYCIYGMAWDDRCSGNPVLWVFSQDGSPPVTIHEFDPVAGRYTGFKYFYTEGFAGGATFMEQDGKGVFVGVSQSQPDQVFGMEICDLPNIYHLSIKVEILKPVIKKPGVLKVKLIVTNSDEKAVSCEIFTRVQFPNGRWYPDGGWLVGPSQITVPARSTRTKVLNEDVSKNALVGMYVYEANVGKLPEIWNTDKSGFIIQ